MARGPGIRPWKRGTEADRSASAAPLPSGDMVVTDDGNVYAGDGSTLINALKRLVRLDEVTAAVQQYVTSLVVTNDTLTEIADGTGFVYAVVDADGRRALGITPDGWVEGKVRLLPGSVTRSSLDSTLSAGLPDTTTPESGLAYAITDSLGRRSWIEVGPDGAPTAHALAKLQTALGAQIGIADRFAAPGQVTTHKIASGPDITAWGDSLTAGGFPSQLATLTGRTVYNGGVGGETSTGIAARQGGLPYLMLPAGGTIPASGGVTVTLTSSGGGTSWPLLQGSGIPDGVMRGTLAGVTGVLTLSQPTTPGPVHQADDVYTFTRDTAGDAVPLTRPAPFYTDFAVARRDDLQVFWYGRNNASAGARIQSDIAASVQFMGSIDKRFLVLSVTNGAGEGNPSSTYTAVTTVNAALFATYGRRFIDARRYLIDYGLADLGITPTGQDNADVAADTIPASLRADSIHLTAAAQGIVAALINARLREMGWI